jgi:hypothetical protein
MLTSRILALASDFSFSSSDSSPTPNALDETVRGWLPVSYLIAES